MERICSIFCLSVYGRRARRESQPVEGSRRFCSSTQSDTVKFLNPSILLRYRTERSTLRFCGRNDDATLTACFSPVSDATRHTQAFLSSDDAATSVSYVRDSERQRRILFCSRVVNLCSHQEFRREKDAKIYEKVTKILTYVCVCVCQCIE